MLRLPSRNQLPYAKVAKLNLPPGETKHRKKHLFFNSKPFNPGDQYFAKPVRSRGTSAVRGPNKDDKERQVCQVGFFGNFTTYLF